MHTAEHDPRVPVFFLSHADAVRPARQTKTPRESYVGRFFDDLSDDVAALISRRVGADPGFMDARMSSGYWEPEILENLGRCQTFVPLLSAAFVESEWCADEWHGFAKRSIHKIDPNGSSNHTAIFPVIWAPVRRDSIPEVVKSTQWFSPGEMYEPAYRENGILGLQRIDNDIYKMAIWLLARKIADSYYRYHVVPLALERSDGKW